MVKKTSGWLDLKLVVQLSVHTFRVYAFVKYLTEIICIRVYGLFCQFKAIVIM